MDDIGLRLHSRWLVRKDLPEVLDIERRQYSDPWNKRDFELMLRNKETLGMVAEVSPDTWPFGDLEVREDPERIAGFCMYSLLRKRIVIHNIAVHPEDTRRGIATEMINRLKVKLAPDKRWRIMAEISEDNLNGQLFFRSQGFLHTKTLRDYWANGHDAYVMEYQLAPCEGNHDGAGIAPGATDECEH